MTIFSVQRSKSMKHLHTNKYNGQTVEEGEGLPGEKGVNGNYNNALAIFSKFGISLTDFGTNWVQKNEDKAWTSVSLSTSGQYQTAVASGDYIYVSTNFGNTWIKSTDQINDTVKSWKSVSLSATGQYQTAVASGDYIYVSSDFGVTWTKASGVPNKNWFSVSLSATGQYQLAVGDDIFATSNDHGVSWSPLTDIQGKFWTCVLVSASGEYQTALAYEDYIYVSTDFGSTFQKANDQVINSEPKKWVSIAISSSCQYQTAVASGSTDGDYIYISTDFGNTWIVKQTDETSNSLQKKWTSVSLSATGQYQTAVANGDYIYVSTDFGNTWAKSQNAPQKKWFDVSLSASGQHQTAVAENGTIYTCISSV
jgi:hypothetical protein